MCPSTWLRGFVCDTMWHGLYVQYTKGWHEIYVKEKFVLDYVYNSLRTFLLFRIHSMYCTRRGQSTGYKWIPFLPCPAIIRLQTSRGKGKQKKEERGDETERDFLWSNLDALRKETVKKKRGRLPPPPPPFPPPPSCECVVNSHFPLSHSQKWAKKKFSAKKSQKIALLNISFHSFLVYVNYALRNQKKQWYCRKRLRKNGNDDSNNGNC